MKKLLSVLALALALCGCGNNTNNNNDKVDENKPAALATLDVATYLTELEKTDSKKVRYDLLTDTYEIEGRFTAEETDFVASVKSAMAALTLTEAASQEKVYGTPKFHMDLNAAYDSNYARFAVFETAEGMIVVILTNEGFKNYTVTDTTQVTALYTLFETQYPKAD